MSSPARQAAPLASSAFLARSFLGELADIAFYQIFTFCLLQYLPATAAGAMYKLALPVSSSPRPRCSCMHARCTDAAGLDPHPAVLLCLHSEHRARVP